MHNFQSYFKISQETYPWTTLEWLCDCGDSANKVHFSPKRDAKDSTFSQMYMKKSTFSQNVCEKIHFLQKKNPPNPDPATGL